MSSSRLGEGCRKMFEYNNTQDRTFRCDQCSKYFKCKGNLQQHKRTHTGERPFKCNYCNKCFSHKGHLNEHRRIHTGEKPFQCNQCDKCFTRGAVLRQHARTHTGEKPFQCNVCGKRFNQKGLLNQHAKTYSGSCLLKEVNFGGTSPGEKKEKHFVCNNCGKSFRNKANLNQHKRTHTGEKEFKCDHCHKRFSHKGHLNEHKRIHTGEKPFKCNHCDKCFNRKGLLNQHQLTYHLLHYLGKMPVTLPTTFAVECLSRNHPEGVDQQTVSLQQGKRIDKQQEALCGNHGTDLETQVETITSTNKEVVLAEELCQESIGVLPASLQRLETPEYATINKMHKVQQENTEDKQWLLSMEDVLGETKIPHTREKPFECKQCGTRFSLRGQLKQHKTTHAGEKRFECNFCLKRFSHKGHFNEHKRIHTGEKPFKCNECEKCFNRKGLLKQHQKLTHQQFNGDTTVQAGNIQSNKYVDKWQESLMCTFGDKSKDQVVIAKKETKTTNKTTNDQSCKDMVVLPGSTNQTVPATRELHACLLKNEREYRQNEANPLTCNRCNTRFAKIDDQEQHNMLCHKGQNCFECKQCGTKFSLRGQLNQHKKNHKGEKRFECSYCYKRFSHKGHLNEHKRIHTGEKPFKCHECEKCFNRKGLLKQHQRLTHRLSHYLNIQMDEEALSENQLDECFTSTENLHTNKFTGERGKSRGANDMFEPQRVVVEMERECTNITETSLLENVVALPSSVQTLVLCEDGEICTSQMGTINRHEEHGENPMEFNHYDNFFLLNEGNLKCSKTERAERQAFQCKHCNKRFSGKCWLSAHERTHTDEKPFACNYCGKRFLTKGSLNQHAKTHTGEKPFKCRYCNKCFGHKGHLNEHERIHTGEKPFTCRECGRCFTRAGVLRQHKRTHTREELSFKTNQSS